jgi:hypothetical protein
MFLANCKISIDIQMMLKGTWYCKNRHHFIGRMELEMGCEMFLTKQNFLSNCEDFKELVQGCCIQAICTSRFAWSSSTRGPFLIIHLL